MASKYVIEDCVVSKKRSSTKDGKTYFNVDLEFMGGREQVGCVKEIFDSLPEGSRVAVCTCKPLKTKSGSIMLVDATFDGVSGAAASAVRRAA